MDRAGALLAICYVLLLPWGRSALPLHAQWGDLLFPLLAIAVFSRAGSRVPWDRRDWPLFVYLGVTLLAALISPFPKTGFLEFVKQAYVAGVFLVFRSLSRDSSLTSRLQRTFILVVAALAAVSIIAVFLLPSGRAPLSPLGWAGGSLPIFGPVLRLRGAFEAPEFLGNALLVALVLSLGFRATADERRRRLWTAAAALFVGAEVLTFSHSVAGFCVAAVFFATGWVRSRAQRIVAWCGALAVVLLVNTVSVVVPIDRDASQPSVFRPVSFDLLGQRVEGRLDHYALLKLVAWSAFLEEPLTGIGPGRFVAETRRAFAEGRVTRRQRGLAPHSSLTGRLAESGIAGFISLLLLWGSWIRGCRRGDVMSSPLRRAAVAAVIGLLVNSLNADVMNFRFLWLALAWAVAPTGDEPKTSGSFTHA